MDEYRQQLAELQNQAQAKSKEMTKALAAAVPAPNKAAATPAPKPSVKPTAAPTPTPATAKAKPTPKPTPVLRLPAPKEPRKSAVAMKKAPEPTKPQTTKPVVSNVPNVAGRSLREVAGLCSRAGVKLKAIGSGLAKSQRQVGDTLIVEFR